MQIDSDTYIQLLQGKAELAQLKQQQEAERHAKEMQEVYNALYELTGALGVKNQPHGAACVHNCEVLINIIKEKVTR